MYDPNPFGDVSRDRRQARSENTQVALTRLLEAARHTAELEALALGDELGLLMAGAGAAELCDELAAVAPLFGSSNVDLPTLQVLAAGTEVRRLAVDGSELYICGRGGDLDRGLLHATAGCARILAEKKARFSH